MAAETATRGTRRRRRPTRRRRSRPRRSPPRRRPPRARRRPRTRRKGAKAEKGKKGKKGKGAEAEEAEEADGGAPSIAAHPRAARAVARAKGWGGLVGFVLGGYMSLPTNTLAAAGLRALIAGVVCYVATWAARCSCGGGW